VEAPDGIEPLIAVLRTAPLATWVPRLKGVCSDIVSRRETESEGVTCTMARI
jgi:hypothetical protein